MRVRQSEPIERGAALPVEVARLSQGRHILEKVSKKCNVADDANGGPDAGGCVPGYNVDLFPATSLYLTATVIEPNAKHWDRKLERYVNGPLTTCVFLQVAGRHATSTATRSTTRSTSPSGPRSTRTATACPTRRACSRCADAFLQDTPPACF